MGMGSFRAGALVVLAALVAGCAAERPVKRVVHDPRRIAKRDLNGTYVFLKSLKRARNVGRLVPNGATGVYQVQNELVQIRLTENWLHVVALDPLFHEGGIAEKRILSSFPVEHVDVLRRQNEDGNDTHEEEVTDKRRPWREREFVSVDFTRDAHDSFGAANLQSVSQPEGVEIDREAGLIQFDVEKELVDGSQVVERYSFLAFRPASGYAQREFPRPLQARFGLFKTRTYGFDAYGRVTEAQRKDFINRWHPGKKIVYYLSPDFPSYLEPTARETFRLWNEAWKKATGSERLELRPNSGQEPGDLRYNLVHYEASRAPGGLLGYGPSVTNPRTGEILKADVFLYGGNLRESLFYLRQWAKAYENAPGLAPSALDAAERWVMTTGATAHEEAGRVTSLAEALRVPPPVLPSPVSPPGGWELAATSFASGDALPSLWAPLSAASLRELPPLDEPWLRRVLPSGLDESRLATLPVSAARETALGASVPAQEAESAEARFAPAHATRIEGFLPALRAGVTGERMTDEELERRVFGSLLAHELGHNFGLRHNFMGSADKAHFAENARTASVMDYAFALHDASGPGPYDLAALQVAYGDESVRPALLAERFLYCGDEEAMTSRNALCGLHDAGTDLVEVAQSHLKRYRVAFDILNRRLGRAFFSQDPERYLGSVAAYLVPARLLIDHAHAILREARALQAAASGSAEQARAAARLWALAKARIEADAGVAQALAVKLGEGMEVRLDTEKIASLTVEAQFAARMAFGALAAVVEDSARPELDEPDLVHLELQTKGVLPDKLLALLLLGGSTADPLTGETVTLYDRLDVPLLALFRSVLSNTRSSAGRSVPFAYNPTVRSLAKEILERDLGRPARLSAESMELIRLESVKPADDDLPRLEKADALRAEFRRLLLEAEEQGLGLLRSRLNRAEKQTKLDAGGLTPEERAALEKEILLLDAKIETERNELQKKARERADSLRKLETERGKIPVADARVGEAHLKAPLEPPGGPPAPTASGALLKDGLNPVEDRLAVYQAFLAGKLKQEVDAATKAAEESGGDEGKIKSLLALQALQAEVEAQVTLFRRYAQMERQFAARLYQAYKPN